MPIRNVDEAALETDVVYRYRYVKEFVGVSASDVEAIRESSGLLREKIPQIADSLLSKLLESDETMRFFAPTEVGRIFRSTARLEDLSPDHPRVLEFRRIIIAFLEELVSGNDDDTSLALKLDAISAPQAQSSRSGVKLPVMHFNAMMGFVSDRLLAKARTLGLPHDREIALITALQKVIWIQMNMMARHYAR